MTNEELVEENNRLQEDINHILEDFCVALRLLERAEIALARVALSDTVEYEVMEAIQSYLGEEDID